MVPEMGVRVLRVRRCAFAQAEMGLKSEVRSFPFWAGEERKYVRMERWMYVTLSVSGASIGGVVSSGD